MRSEQTTSISRIAKNQTPTAIFGCPAPEGYLASRTPISKGSRVTADGGFIVVGELD
jgi:hypothetical protein